MDDEIVIIDYSVDENVPDTTFVGLVQKPGDPPGLTYTMLATGVTPFRLVPNPADGGRLWLVPKEGFNLNYEAKSDHKYIVHVAMENPDDPDFFEVRYFIVHMHAINDA